MKAATDISAKDAHWKHIYDFTIACGRADNPKKLAIEILNNLGVLCSFDQALVYFLDGNGKVCDQHLMNIEERWSNMYLEYYFKTENNQYSYYLEEREGLLNAPVYVRDWDNERSTEFVPNLIRPRGLKYTCAFVMRDLNDKHRTIIALDRAKKKDFSNDELTNLKLAVPQLNNLHKNFYYRAFSQRDIKKSTFETANLSGREIEVVDLLCQGISPANISRNLHITLATTNKHIANIYRKMRVSSLQELLVRILQ